MATVTKDDILRKFALFETGNQGIESWLNAETDDTVFQRLSELASEDSGASSGIAEPEPDRSGEDDNEFQSPSVSALSFVQLNQLLVLGHEAGMSEGFFRYYWLVVPNGHPYDVRKVCTYKRTWAQSKEVIVSLDHLYWGFYRIYVDALLYFGNVRTAYRALRSRTFDEIKEFFDSKRFPTQSIKSRGPALPLHTIGKDDRYLISEMACKSLEAPEEAMCALREAVTNAYETDKFTGIIKIEDLLKGEFVKKNFQEKQLELQFSADEILAETIESKDQLSAKLDALEEKWARARESALKNTQLYLSMVRELDVYVATSMRNRTDFRKMADVCTKVFSDGKIRDLHLRYFDPTLSSAESHEDKGLIECLMVKCAKVLIYSAGEKESYGKDAEAAMALSQGKPVIFLCDEAQRERFYREVHPLSRLIDFSSGVAVGAIVTSDVKVVPELLKRIFENKMEYTLEQKEGNPGFLLLKENLTKSVVRIQTNNGLLSSAFWDYYHDQNPLKLSDLYVTKAGAI